MSSISAQGVVERASVELAKRINGKMNTILFIAVREKYIKRVWNYIFNKQSKQACVRNIITVTEKPVLWNV